MTLRFTWGSSGGDRLIQVGSRMQGRASGHTCIRTASVCECVCECVLCVSCVCACMSMCVCDCVYCMCV